MAIIQKWSLKDILKDIAKEEKISPIEVLKHTLKTKIFRWKITNTNPVGFLSKH